MLDKTLQQEILDHLKPIHPQKVILFGSYAYGEPDKDSDKEELLCMRLNSKPTRTMA